MPFPLIEADEHWFAMTFKRRSPVEGGTAAKGETKKKIFRLMEKNPNITMLELAKELGLSRSGIEYNIRQLKKEGLVERKGTDKVGTWKLLP